MNSLETWPCGNNEVGHFQELSNLCVISPHEDSGHGDTCSQLWKWSPVAMVTSGIRDQPSESAPVNATADGGLAKRLMQESLFIICVWLRAVRVVLLSVT